LENEALAVEEHEDCRWEEKVPRGSRRIRRRNIAAGVSTAAKSQPAVEKVKSEDGGSAGAPQQWVSSGEGGRHVARHRGRTVSHEKNPDEIPMFTWFAERG
jgi:hypothetical protein